ncbi:MAG: phosphatase PAP2 family protein [Flavobacteriales bacterium]|nr:phosphatase PAP2 family protein [Flavobacteriales bacterium]
MERVAYAISVVFHPILIPIYLFLLIAEIDPVMNLFFTTSLKWRFVSSLFITTVIGPALSMYLLKRRGLIADLEMSQLKGRSLMFIITVLYYMLTYYMLKDLELPGVIHGMFLSLITTLILLALVSIRYKISAHMAALGGVSAMMFWIFVKYGIWQSNWILGIFFLAAIVASSRLLLQAHRPHEVGTGYLLGLCCVYATMNLVV